MYVCILCAPARRANGPAPAHGKGRTGLFQPAFFEPSNISGPQRNPFSLPVKTVFLLITISLFLPGLPLPVYAGTFNPAYELDAGVEINPPQVKGTVKITFTNPSLAQITDVPVMLYPNRFLSPPASLQEEIYKKSFPMPFSPGSIEISQALDAAGQPLEFRFSESDLGPKVTGEILLREPLPSGQSTTITLYFTTRIPERLGGFGHFKSVISLEGGWHPYLPDFFDNRWQFHKPPPKSIFTVNLSYPIEFEINHTGNLLSKTLFNDNKTSLLKAEEASFFSLILSKRYTDMVAEYAGHHAVFYAYFSKDRKYAKKVTETARNAVAFFEAEHGPARLSVLRLSEAYLYEDLYAEGEGIVFVSHLLYKIFPPLKNYHEARLLHGIFAQMWRAQIPWAEDWVIEMLSDYTTQSFFYRELNHPLEGIEKFLKPFAFLPVVDEMLYSPNLSFRQIYFKEAKPFPFREQVRLYNTPRMEGAGILFKMQNILGREKTHEIVSQYLESVRLGENPSFIQLSEDLSHQNLQEFFRQWLETYPEPDFGIKKVESRSEDGTYLTTVIVTKKGEGTEPVQVRATLMDQTTLEETLPGDQVEESVTFGGAKPVTVVELDPDHLTNDPYLFNNRKPHKWKFLLDKFNGALDLQTHTPELEIGGSFRRVYDNNNIFSLYYFNFEETRGVRGDFTHTFRPVLNDRIGQSILANYRVERARIPGAEDETRGSVGAIYNIGFLKFNFGLEYNLQFTGPDKPYNFRIYFNETEGIRWSPYRTLAFKTRLAESFGPLNSPFYAGGGNGLRGYTKTAISGSTQSLFSLEYSFPLYIELDQNVGGLMLLHTLQGQLFLDTGNASEEKNLFLFNQYRSNFGGGMNLELDLFGAYPTNMMVQIAYPIDPFIPEERNFKYYFNFGVHFF